ncbi:hypothetical protein M407DRAFT_75690, partial [Tulasnella calospora MUT 4182]
DPKLWDGIGILYVRYGSLDNAEEAFSSVCRMDANFEKAEEILFRLATQWIPPGDLNTHLFHPCINRIFRKASAPLANPDIWLKIGQVYALANNVSRAPTPPF